MRWRSLVLHVVWWWSLVLRHMMRRTVRGPVRTVRPVRPASRPTQLVVRRPARHYHARPVGARPIWTTAKEISRVWTGRAARVWSSHTWIVRSRWCRSSLRLTLKLVQGLLCG